MEITEKDYVIGILKGGRIIKKRTLQELITIPHIEHFVIQKYAYTFKGPVNITDWYQYFFVDIHGNPTILKNHNFEVIYIDKDQGCTNFSGRNIHIYDSLKDTTYIYYSRKSSESFLTEELIPLLNKLHYWGSWEAYELSVEYEKLQNQYAQLKENQQL